VVFCWSYEEEHEEGRTGRVQGKEAYREKVEQHGEGEGVKKEGDEIRNVGSNEEVYFWELYF
jgi:hypothetical protein